MSAYEGLARYYDGLTADVDYTQWMDWYGEWFRESAVPVKIVLDLACGTGTLTCMLAEAGYSVIGADLSAEMLAEAMEKAAEVEGEAPIFLNQSMDELDLFGTIDACVSSLDSINYGTEESVLREAFHRVHTFLMPGGYFLFDIIAPEWLEKLDGELFVDENEDVFCVWRASFDPEEQILTYGMDLFERDGEGEEEVWFREQEEHNERAWEPEALRSMLTEAGFCDVQIFGGMERRKPEHSDRRLCFVCVNGEGGQTPGQV